MPSTTTVVGTELRRRQSPASDDPEAATEKSNGDEEIEEPQLSVQVCIGLLIAVTVVCLFSFLKGKIIITDLGLSIVSSRHLGISSR